MKSLTKEFSARWKNVDNINNLYIYMWLCDMWFSMWGWNSNNRAMCHSHAHGPGRAKSSLVKPKQLEPRVSGGASLLSGPKWRFDKVCRGKTVDIRNRNKPTLNRLNMDSISGLWQNCIQNIFGAELPKFPQMVTTFVEGSFLSYQSKCMCCMLM